MRTHQSVRKERGGEGEGAYCGAVWRGTALCGAARRGVARRGVARRGVTRRGVARRGVCRGRAGHLQLGRNLDVVPPQHAGELRIVDRAAAVAIQGLEDHIEGGAAARVESQEWQGRAELGLGDRRVTVAV